MRNHFPKPGRILRRWCCQNHFNVAVLLLCLLVSAGVSRGATIVMTNNDAFGTTSFNTGQNWAGGLPPAAGNSYQTAGYMLRTPATATGVAFAGDSLELQTGSVFRDKTAATVTVTNFILDGGSTLEITQPNNVNAAGASGNLAGAILLNGTVFLHAGLAADAAGEIFYVNSTISGPGGFDTTGSSGNVVLTGTNNHSGLTTVNAGTLLINGVQTASAVSINAGVLGGTGVIKAAVTNQVGGTLQPGLGGTDTSTLTISNNLVLAGTTVSILNRGNGQKAAKIAGISTLTLGGTLTVTNAGATLQIGDAFTLFSAMSYTGSFAAVNLPALSANLQWSNSLAVNGTITVVTNTSFPSGTWTNDASGNWSTTANWSGGAIPSGSGVSAYFDLINLTADRTVTLDSARTIGKLYFGDSFGSQNWFLNNSGGSILTLAGTPTITVDNNAATVSLPLAGTQGLTKAGTGTLVLSGNNTYTGANTVNAGTLNITGTVPGTGLVAVGSTTTASNAILNVSGSLSGSRIDIGNYNGGVGALYQTGGTINAATASGIDNTALGNVAGSFGYCAVLGGTLSTAGLVFGGENDGNFGAIAGNGIMEVYNGASVNNTGWLVMSRSTAASAQTSVLNIFGGSLSYAGGGLVCNWGSGGQVSIINMLGGSVTTAGDLPINFNAGAGNLGVLNCNGGSIQAGWVTGTSGRVNFNGGTLAADENQTVMLTGVTANIYGGGGTINNNGFALGIGLSLQAPAGAGVNGIASFTGGAGYIAPPIVTVVPGAGDTTGVGATAIAQIDRNAGVVTNVIITCPGVNYTATPTFTVTGGGATTAATISGQAPTPNVSGGLTSTGAGSLTLSGANTFMGATVVNGGTLALAAGGSLASTNILVNSGATLDVSAISFTLGANQNLSGSGTVNGDVTTGSGSKIFAGTDGGIGTNTFTGNLTFGASASAQFDLGSLAAGANDQIVLTGAGATLTGGGAGIGIKCGAVLDTNGVYTLFNVTGSGAGIAGGFNATPVWTGTTPNYASGFAIATVGNTVVLHYSSGATNLPAVTNGAASAVVAQAATLNGQVTSTGGQIPAVSIYYGTTDGGTSPSAWDTNVSLGLQGGSFSATVSNLAASTTYYFAALATNAAGAVWAAPSLSFTTLAANLAVITNLPAGNVQGASAILNGQVISSGSSTPNVTLYYGPADGGTNAGAWANSIYLGAQSGSYAVTAMGLMTNTAYYFTAEAVNSDGAAWAQPSLAFTTLTTAPVVAVTTYHYDNACIGANTNEVLLTPAQVNTNNFGRIIKYPTDGYIYTQPLYVPNVTIPGQGVHNVVYVASEHDTIYAFDADSAAGANGGLLWKTNLGISVLSANGEFGNRYCGTCFPDIVPEVGVTGTPVIDPATGTLYVNVATREVVPGVSTNYIHRIHALNITNGTERPYSPVVVSGSVPGVGTDSVGGVMTFNGKQANQRPALTLAGGILYVAYAGYADTDPYHGWLFGYNATNLAPVSVFNTTPNAKTSVFGSHAAEGGIWMGGHGLVVDEHTNLYYITGNGSFSANTNGGDYADTVMKMATTNGLTVADYFTPYNQLALANADTDLGAVGPVLLPDSVGSVAHPHLLAAGGKGGTIYLLDRENMGGYSTSGSDGQIVQSVIGATATIWSSPAYWNNRLFYQPANSSMKAYTITNGVIGSTPVSASASFGAFNGGPVVSANGTNNGIVWVINGAGGGATEVLYAYNATNISQTLYSSSQILARDNPGGGIKMITPTVANGKVYVGAQYALNVYGYTAFLATPVIAPGGGPYTNSVLVTLTEATPGAAIYYTVDGTTPTTNSLLYTAPFMVTTTVSVSAIAVKSGAANSAVATASFINTAAVGSGTGLLGQYWTNTPATTFTNIAFATGATLTRTDAVVAFDWSGTPPSPVIGSTNYTVRWTGCVQPQYSENYTFTTAADDGVRLWVNGQLLVNDWTTHTSVTTNSGVINLNAQQLYNVRLEYLQNTGNASVQLQWSSASTAQGVIPQTQLYPFTNPPPSVVLTQPTNGSSYTALASVSLGADADAPYNPISAVEFFANGVSLGILTNSSYTPSYYLTTTGLSPGNYTLTAVATDGSGLSSTSAPVSLTVATGSGQPYGLTTNGTFAPFGNMPTTFGGALPTLLSGSGVFANTAARTPANGVLPYNVNTILWSDAAMKSRLMAVPHGGGPLTPDQQIGFTTNNYWTFPAGTIFVKNFDLVVNETNAGVPLRRLETRLLVRDINGGVYGVTYKWRPDNSDADLLYSSLSEAVLITNATGVRTQEWYYPSPSDCLTCHTPQAGYVLGVNTRQLNGDLTYPATGNTDNQLRTLNRLGLLNPAFDETNIAGFTKMYALTNTSASLELRARSYLDANCAHCHRPGGAGPTFDGRFDTPLAGQNLIYGALDTDGQAMIVPKDRWRSEVWQRMDTTNNAIKMPPLARSLVDSNALQVLADWIDSLPGTPAQAPPTLTPTGGNFVASVNVSAQAPDTNAVIYYTLDGTVPTTNSLVYTGPFTLLDSATVAASSFRTGYVNSISVSALFLVEPLHFAGQTFSNHVFQLMFAGSAGSNYVLQATTNFVNWADISTNTPTTNFFNLLDPKATNYPYRFYRVLRQ